MRLLFISNLYPWPGQPTRGTFNVQTVRALASQNDVTVRVLVPEWRVWRWSLIRRWKSPEGEGAYLPVFYFPVVGRRCHGWTYRCSLAREQNLIERDLTDCEAVLVPWLYPDGAAIANLGRRAGKPVWLMALGSDTLGLNSCCRDAILKACREAQGIMCVCQLLADRLTDAGVPQAKIHVVPNGVDASLFRFRSAEETSEARSQAEGRSSGHSAVAESVGIPNAPCILFIANLVPIKGPDVMLRAFAALRQTTGHRPQTEDGMKRTGGERANRKGTKDTKRYDLEPATQELKKGNEIGQNMDEQDRQDAESNGLRSAGLSCTSCPSMLNVQSPVSLLVIGSGPMRAGLERQARELGIAEHVHFLGNRPHSEVALWMNRADVLCLASRNEGMPNVVVEALASGLPVVATDVGACREMLEGEPAARICRSEDTDGLARALCEVLAMKVDRKAMAERYAGKYSWRKTAETIVRLMEEHGEDTHP